jgi:hypothetical protein
MPKQVWLSVLAHNYRELDRLDQFVGTMQELNNLYPSEKNRKNLETAINFRELEQSQAVSQSTQVPATASYPGASQSETPTNSPSNSNDGYITIDPEDTWAMMQGDNSRSNVVGPDGSAARPNLLGNLSESCINHEDVGASSACQNANGMYEVYLQAFQSSGAEVADAVYQGHEASAKLAYQFMGLAPPIVSDATSRGATPGSSSSGSPAQGTLSGATGSANQLQGNNSSLDQKKWQTEVTKVRSQLYEAVNNSNCKGHGEILELSCKSIFDKLQRADGECEARYGGSSVQQSRKRIDCLGIAIEKQQRDLGELKSRLGHCTADQISFETSFERSSPCISELTRQENEEKARCTELWSGPSKSKQLRDCRYLAEDEHRRRIRLFDQWRERRQRLSDNSDSSDNAHHQNPTSQPGTDETLEGKVEEGPSKTVSNDKNDIQPVQSPSSGNNSKTDFTEVPLVKGGDCVPYTGYDKKAKCLGNWTYQVSRGPDQPPRKLFKISAYKNGSGKSGFLKYENLTNQEIRMGWRMHYGDGSLDGLGTTLKPGVYPYSSSCYRCGSVGVKGISAYKYEILEN